MKITVNINQPQVQQHQVQQFQRSHLVEMRTAYWKHRGALFTVARFAGIPVRAVYAALLSNKD